MWPILVAHAALLLRSRACSHVLEVMADPRPPVRAAAIEALGRAISGALASLPAAAAGEAAAAAAAADERAASAADSTGGVEHMLLVALEALYSASVEPDVRSGVLRVLISVLQVRLCWSACAALLGWLWAGPCRLHRG
jgi:hypothetical protein